jgi:hypothetical protein
MTDEQGQVKETLETKNEASVQGETTTQEKTTEDKSLSQQDIENIVRTRLARERAKIYKELGTDNLDEVKELMQQKETAQLEEKKKRGEFEDILKEQANKYQSEIQKLQSDLKNIKINDALLGSASKNRAINPQQVVELLKNSVQLNDEGQVEVLADNGTPRYNKDGNLYSVEEYVSEFLTQNPHFQMATPSGSGSKGNVGKVDAKPFNLAELDLNNPEQRKQYVEYRNNRSGFSMKPKLTINN